ncbi:MAG TPA: hypothetical protein VHQ90_10860 [Thermoanaerobaculia bacterium]|nr:hypothetical protein [Thermoanaerobaculia bacterium]
MLRARIVLLSTAAILLTVWLTHTPAAGLPLPGKLTTAPPQQPAPDILSGEVNASSTEPNSTSTAEDFAAKRAEEAGKLNQARVALENAILERPDSSSLHEKLATTLFDSYGFDTTNSPALWQAAEEAVKAFDLSKAGGQIDSRLLWLLAHTLGEAKDRVGLNRVFQEAVALDPTPEVFLNYARGLVIVGDARAEEAFNKSIALKAEENPAVVEYGEWLLDAERNREALQVLSGSGWQPYYAHLLRGVALERLNRPGEAKNEYAQFAEFSKAFPAPSKYRIKSSQLQEDSGIHFENESQNRSTKAAVSSSQLIVGLSYLIGGEAIGESPGGQRAVGWEPRNRTLRGSVPNTQGLSCPYVTNTGSALPDQYATVICQSGAFDGKCSAWCSDRTYTGKQCSRDSHTDAAAYDVYWGYAPDAVGQHCPGGFSSGSRDYCNATARCQGLTTTFKIRGALFNRGTSGTCPTPRDDSRICTTFASGKVCGDGKRDNCFYYNPNWSGRAMVGSLPRTGSSQQQPNNSYYYSASSKTHKGHLEGDEDQNFDLYLYKWSGSAWIMVKSSTLPSSVEDVTYAGGPGYYAWLVVSARGSGVYSLWITSP